MQIWIVINGEKQGPFADYEVRRKISEGEYTAETMAWHEGLSEWMPLARIPVFEREFWTEAEDASVDSEEISVETPAADAARMPTFWMRRFWARWLDLYLFTGLLWLVLYAAHADIGSVLRNPWLMLPIYLPWVPVEAWFIKRHATTPGKWIMGLRVVNEDGSQLDMRQALRRAIRVYFLGIGMGWGFVAPICQTLSLIHVRATGKTLWDLHSKHRVEGKDWQWFRVPICVIVFMIATQMQFIVIGPYLIEEAVKQYPGLAQWMEKNPPKHLPKRH